MRDLLPEEDHFESFVARETIRFLETYRDEPLFVVASFLKPHNPFAPPAEFAARYRAEDMPLLLRTGDGAELPAQIRSRMAPHAGTPAGDDWARRFLAAYYGNVSHMDACAGRILDALQRLGLAENTLVLYTTDHGEMAYEHGLRGKFNFFEGSARIPLLARLPGRVPAGSASDALVDQADFVPTLLDVCGLPAASNSRPVDGASFAPALADPGHPGKSFAFGEFSLDTPAPFYMRRGPRWKYVLYTGGAPAQAEALYDMVDDPGETRNLAADPASFPVREAERAALLAYLRAQGAPVPQLTPPRPPSGAPSGAPSGTSRAAAGGGSHHQQLRPSSTPLRRRPRVFLPSSRNPSRTLGSLAARRSIISGSSSACSESTSRRRRARRLRSSRACRRWPPFFCLRRASLLCVA